MQNRLLLLCTCLAIMVHLLCCCSTLRGPRPPYTVTPSGEAIERLRKRWEQSLQAGADGSVSVTITEEEMTSLMVELLARQGDTVPFSDPQVLFRDGRIEVYATVTQNGMPPLPGMVAFSAAAVDGEVRLAVTEAQVGPFSLPPAALEEATQALNDALMQGIPEEAGHVTVTAIQVGDQEISISGVLTP